MTAWNAGLRVLEHRDTILGVVRHCNRCNEDWPLDGEFWYFQHGRVLGHCKACWSEINKAYKAARKSA